MLRGKVKIITNGTGNIKNIVQNWSEEVITVEDIIHTLELDKTNKSFSYKWQSRLHEGQQYAQRQDWDVRVYEWLSLFKDLGITWE